MVVINIKTFALIETSVFFLINKSKCNKICTIKFGYNSYNVRP